MKTKNLLFAVIFTLLSATLYPDEIVITITAKGGINWEGKVVNQNDKGLTLEIKQGIPIFFSWDELTDETKAKLQNLMPDALPAKKEGEWLKGAEVTTKDGNKIVGRLETSLAKDPDAIVIRSGGKLWNFKKEEVSIREMEIPLASAYSPEELYEIAVDSRIPRTADNHKLLADRCLKLGLVDKADYHYKISNILKREGGQFSRLADVLRKLEEFRSSESLQDIVYVLEKGLIDQEFDDAIKLIKLALQKPNDSQVIKELTNIRQELEILKNLRVQEKIALFVEMSVDSQIQAISCNRNVDFSKAVGVVDDGVLQKAFEQASVKFNLPKDNVENFWRLRSAGKTCVISYGAATWLAEAPQADELSIWWNRSSNQDRYNYLMGYFVEQNMFIVKIFHKGCSLCGGKGETSEHVTCKACNGLGHIRNIIYK